MFLLELLNFGDRPRMEAGTGILDARHVPGRVLTHMLRLQRPIEQSTDGFKATVSRLRQRRFAISEDSNGLRSNTANGKIRELFFRARKNRLIPCRFKDPPTHFLRAALKSAE